MLHDQPHLLIVLASRYEFFAPIWRVMRDDNMLVEEVARQIEAVALAVKQGSAVSDMRHHSFSGKLEGAEVRLWQRHDIRQASPSSSIRRCFLAQLQIPNCHHIRRRGAAPGHVHAGHQQQPALLDALWAAGLFLIIGWSCGLPPGGVLPCQSKGGL